MINIIKIDGNVDMLNQFLSNKLPVGFRYFNKRNIDIIKNHVITILLLEDETPIGYAHVDFDNDKYWFGICILEKYHGLGYGTKIIDYIFNHELVKKTKQVYLSVDRSNLIALSLYKKHNFYIIDETDSYLIMVKDMLL